MESSPALKMSSVFSVQIVSIGTSSTVCVQRCEKLALSPQPLEVESSCCLDALGTVASHKKVCASGEVENQEKFESSTLDSRNSIDDEYLLKTSINSEKNLPSIEMLGDNIDVTITPSKMTSDTQRKSLNWFLVMMKLKNITVKDMNISELGHEKNISTLPKACWIPDKCQQESLKENIKHHISHILLKYVDFLRPVKSVIPPYIAHKFIELTKTKSVFLIVS